MSRSNSLSSPFVRSQKLLEYYRMIGSSLIEYESSQTGIGAVIDLSHYKTPFAIPLDFKSFFRKSILAFEQGVVFVPVEYLESFLEDLLDLDVSEEDLFIIGKKKLYASGWISLLGLAGSLATGLYTVSLGASLLFSFALTVFIALPFGILWHYAPRDRLSRRIRFARLLQSEVSRRRGDTGPFVSTPLRAVTDKFFGKATVGSARSILAKN